MSNSPITPSQHPDPLAASPSKVPPANAEALAAVDGTVKRLRAELAGTHDKTRQARLLGEIGELEERAGDEPGAARDYLAAFNADPSFREPLEGLVRLLERRRSLKNLGKLVDALVRAANNPDEKARALMMKASYLEDVATDVDGALQAVREATTIDAPAAETSAAWLALEILAAKKQDSVLREEALAERATFAADATWKALVLLDVARLAASRGDVDPALAKMREAAALRGAATFAAFEAIERLARSDPGMIGSEVTRARADALAWALESQAELLDKAIASPDEGEALGVPRWVRSPANLADAWLRAAEARRANGELGRAAETLDRARGALLKDESDRAPLLEAALLHARIRIAELMGDTALAASLAEQRLAREPHGAVAAALAMRVAEHAASLGDGARALDALSRAVQHDPACLPARALQLDLLADAGDHTAFAAQLESFADHLATDEARGRAFLLAAYVWALRAGDTAGAKAALSQAQMFGVPPAIVARLARTMAALKDDAGWYEDATRRLLASGAAESEIVPLHVELLRARSAVGDGEGARKALRELGATPKGRWLGRALEAFLPDRVDPEQTAARGDDRGRAALDELAAIEPEPEVARGLALLAAARAHACGDVEGARRRLTDLHANDASDPIVGAYLAELARKAGDHGAAADVASAASNATGDAELAAALRFEAGFERWRAGDRKGGIEAFEAARDGAPEAAAIVLAWAERAMDPDRVEGRRRAIERGIDAGADPRVLALERFATEVCGGDADDAAGALSALDAEPIGELPLAGALARLAWTMGSASLEGRNTALAKIAAQSSRAATFAAAENARFARESGDVEETTAAARTWSELGGGLPAALEWLAAATASSLPDEQRTARETVARQLTGEAREQMASAAALSDPTQAVADGAAAPPLLAGDSAATRLTNLELAPPGCDPRRRAIALVEVDDALGEEAQIDALALAGWAALAAGDAKAARAAWERATHARPDDIASWEGLRTCAESLGDKPLRARASQEIGSRCADSERAARFLEQAALLYLELGNGDKAERALDAAFARDAKRPVAFDKLFRRVRERSDNDKLLALIGRRLEVTDEPQEIAKLFWEQARALRAKGDQDGALKALEHVTMLEPDHVGALALTGEIALKRGKFEEAANALARLSTLDAAPAKNRVTAGVAAVDILENKLSNFERALEVLVGLHKARLSTLPVRERLARAAARTGTWPVATQILEELMFERPEAEGRVEAARLAMAIHRDRLHEVNGARRAIVKLLEESPMDGEAIDMLLQTEHPREVKERLFANARAALLAHVAMRPTDLPAVRRLAKIARATGDDGLQQSALSVAAVLGGGDAATEQALAQLAIRKPRTPSVAITPALFRAMLAPGDEGAIAELFAALGPTLAEALGPSLQVCGVTKKDKVDPRSGLSLRNEITTWAGAFNVAEYDLFIGGKDALSVQGVPGETPSLVVGSGVNAPLAPVTRGRVARELSAMVRGSTVCRSRDDITIAAIVVAACRIAEVPIEHPPYAVLAEVEKLISKAISRKTRKLLPDLCRAVIKSGVDARAWHKRALMSHARVATIASGDVGVVLTEMMNEPVERLPQSVKGDARAEELLKFVLSPAYLELRRALGLEGAQ